MLLLKGMESKKRILCCREIQRSIRDSIHRLLSDLVAKYDLGSFYKVSNESITGINGTNFIFKGLYQNIDSVKSIEGVDLCHVEEAQSISRKSLDVLIPTIRKEKSRIIFTFNPTTKEDVVYTDFVVADREDTLKINANYDSNPFFPDVLRQEMEWCRKTDIDRYNHVWLGYPVQHSDAQVFNGKWIIDDFETPEGVNFYYGLDFGFSVDPNAFIRCFIKDDRLYIDYEAGGVGIDIDRTPDMMRRIPESSKWTIVADSARPETISYLRQRGFQITAAKKGRGSVEDGIAKIRSFDKVIIHPRCKQTIDEFRLYSYKTDRLTDKLLPVPEDTHNHYIDAIRYAIENINRRGSVIQYTGW